MKPNLSPQGLTASLFEGGAKESNMNDNPRKKSKRIVAPILYDKYKDIPRGRPIKNKLPLKTGNPEFVKSLNTPIQTPQFKEDHHNDEKR